MSEKIIISRIMAVLEKNPNGLSIGAIGRALGGKIHRVYLSGYLEAFSQIGLLEELNIPPARVFRVRGGLDGFKNVQKLLQSRLKKRSKILALINEMMQDDEELNDEVEKLLEGGI